MDRQTELINWTCSIFDNDLAIGVLNRDCHYTEFRPEPVVAIKSSDKTKTPDIVAVNFDKRLLLIIEGKGGADPLLKEKLGLTIDISKHLTQLNEYTNIDIPSLKKYFDKIDGNSKFDVVVIVFEDSYQDFKKLENDFKNGCFWVCDLKNKHIRKTDGKHKDDKLNKITSEKPYIQLSHSESTPFYIYFSRHSPKDNIIAEALSRLLIYSYSNQDFELSIEKIDNILMKDISPEPASMKPMLWQFTKDERMKRWRQLIGIATDKKHKWMKEVKQGVYRFLKPDGNLVDENLLNSTLRVLLRQFNEFAQNVK